MVQDISNDPKQSPNAESEEEIKALDMSALKQAGEKAGEKFTQKSKSVSKAPMDLDAIIETIDQTGNIPELEVVSVGKINFSTFGGGGQSYSIPVTCRPINPIPKAIVHVVENSEETVNGKKQTTSIYVKNDRGKFEYEEVENYDGDVTIWFKLGKEELTKVLNDVELTYYVVPLNGKSYPFFEAFLASDHGKHFVDAGTGEDLQFFQGFIPNLVGYKFKADYEPVPNRSDFRVKATTIE